MGTTTCTIVGQKYRGGTSYTANAAYVGYGGGTCNDYVLAFTTGNFTGVSKSITFEIKMSNGTITPTSSTRTYRYALLSSDANAMGATTSTNYYLNTYNDVEDPNQIAKGTVDFADVGKDTHKVLTINVAGLMPNTRYYLVLYPYSTTYSQLTVSLTQYHNPISLSYEEGLLYIYGCNAYESGSASASIIGQSWRNNDYSTGVAYAGYYDSLYYDYSLKFTTPSFIGVSDSITFNIKMYNSDYATSTLRYAICTSDANRSLYKNHGDAVNNDEYQIATGVVTFENVNQDTVKSFSVTTGELNQSGTYYLFLWQYSGATLMNVSIRDTSYHSISVDYNTPSDENKVFSYEPYVVYIDNGTDWDMYIPYIDNGTGWDIVC